MASKWTDKRPMAPHLQIWRWHPAMLSSILHRICAVISYGALIKFSFGLLYLKKTNELPFTELIYSPLGLIALFVIVFALVFMALAQLRHLVWDQGKAFDPAFNNKLSWGMIALALIVAIVFTVCVVSKGGA